MGLALITSRPSESRKIWRSRRNVAGRQSLSELIKLKRRREASMWTARLLVQGAGPRRCCGMRANEREPMSAPSHLLHPPLPAPPLPRSGASVPGLNLEAASTRQASQNKRLAANQFAYRISRHIIYYTN